MKKYIGTLIAGVTLMAALPVGAKADDQKTTADIELTQDEQNKDITLDAVPGVDFGTNTMENGTKTYEAKTVSGSTKVTNPGNEDGWDVQVAATEFKDGDKVLQAAALTFDQAAVQADDSANVSKLPTSSKVTLNSSGQSILTAQSGDGIGKFTATHAADKVSLLVPAGNSAGKYQATLTWTLANAPK